MSPSSLQVYENGELITPTAITNQGEIGPLTTLLVIDISGSMYSSNKMVGAKEAARIYVEQMRPQDQAGLISFNTEVKLVQPVTGDRAALIAAINSLMPDRDTAMFNALAKGIETLAPITGRKAIILLSDGLDNVSQLTLDDIVNTIGPAGLSISTIGLGDASQTGTNEGLDENALQDLASRAGGAYRFAGGPDVLVAFYEQLGRALQGEISITYLSPLALRNGVDRELTVSINDNSINPNTIRVVYCPKCRRVHCLYLVGFWLVLLILLALPFLLKGGGKRSDLPRVRQR